MLALTAARAAILAAITAYAVQAVFSIDVTLPHRALLRSNTIDCVSSSTKAPLTDEECMTRLLAIDPDIEFCDASRALSRFDRGFCLVFEDMSLGPVEVRGKLGIVVEPPKAHLNLPRGPHIPSPPGLHIRDDANDDNNNNDSQDPAEGTAENTTLDPNIDSNDATASNADSEDSAGKVISDIVRKMKKDFAAQFSKENIRGRLDIRLVDGKISLNKTNLRIYVLDDSDGWEGFIDRIKTLIAKLKLKFKTAFTGKLREMHISVKRESPKDVNDDEENDLSATDIHSYNDGSSNPRADTTFCGFGADDTGNEVVCSKQKSHLKGDLVNTLDVHITQDTDGDGTDNINAHIVESLSDSQVENEDVISFVTQQAANDASNQDTANTPEASSSKNKGKDKGKAKDNDVSAQSLSGPIDVQEDTKLDEQDSDINDNKSKPAAGVSPRQNRGPRYHPLAHFFVDKPKNAFYKSIIEDVMHINTVSCNVAGKMNTIDVLVSRKLILTSMDLDYMRKAACTARFGKQYNTKSSSGSVSFFVPESIVVDVQTARIAIPSEDSDAKYMMINGLTELSELKGDSIKQNYMHAVHVSSVMRQFFVTSYLGIATRLGFTIRGDKMKLPIVMIQDAEKGLSGFGHDEKIYRVNQQQDPVKMPPKMMRNVPPMMYQDAHMIPAPFLNPPYHSSYADTVRHARVPTAPVLYSGSYGNRMVGNNEVRGRSRDRVGVQWEANPIGPVWLFHPNGRPFGNDHHHNHPEQLQQHQHQQQQEEYEHHHNHQQDYQQYY